MNEPTGLAFTNHCGEAIHVHKDDSPEKIWEAFMQYVDYVNKKYGIPLERCISSPDDPRPTEAVMSDSQDRSEHIERIAKIINPIAFNGTFIVNHPEYDEEKIKSDCREEQAKARHKAKEILKYLARNRG